MESFADRLAQRIIRDVKNDFGHESGQTTDDSQNGIAQTGHIFKKFQHRPYKRTNSSQLGFTERKRRNEEDKEIDILADRLTTEIIDYATSSGKIFYQIYALILILDVSSKGRKKERRARQEERDQMEIYSDSTQPASEYQKTVIKYQNSDAAFLGKL